MAACPTRHWQFQTLYTCVTGKSWKGPLLRVSTTKWQPLQVTGQLTRTISPSQIACRKQNEFAFHLWCLLQGWLVSSFCVCVVTLISHKSNHSKAYSSVALCIFKMLYKHNLHLPPKQFITSVENPVPIKLSQPLENFNLLSVSTDLPILDILWKCNHTICDLLYLVPFLA